MSGRWIKFFPTDWLHGTRMLTPVERGVYITLISMMYDNEGPIPNNPKLLARECGMRVDGFVKVLADLVEMGKLECSQDTIINAKTSVILQSLRDRSEKARKGGLAKAAKDKENQQSNSALADSEQSVSTAEELLEASTSDAIQDTRSKRRDKKASKLAKKDLGEVQLEDESDPELVDEGLEADLRHAANWFHTAPRLSHVKPIADLIERGLSLTDDVIPTIRQLAPNVEHRTSWTYFVGALEDILRRRTAATPAPAEAATPATRTSVWVWRDTPQWDAWSAGRTRPWPTTEQSHPSGGRRPGWYFPSEWPPGYRGSDPPPETLPAASAAPARAGQTA